MIKTEDKNDDEEYDIEDMGNDQDDLEISDEEKPDVSGLFLKPNNNNKELLNKEIKEEPINKKIMKKQKLRKQKICQIMEMEKSFIR